MSTIVVSEQSCTALVSFDDQCNWESDFEMIRLAGEEMVKSLNDEVI